MISNGKQHLLNQICCQNRDGRSEQLLYNEEGHMRNILNWGNMPIQIQRFCWENLSGEVARLDIHMNSC
jgi:hypothetical protein